MKLPLVFNDKLTDLVQISMRGSVGNGGNNAREDVILIQGLLNRADISLGGPSVKLTVDGLVGPKTVSAIAHYQKVSRLVADGRIDPARKTIRQLVPALRDRGLLKAPIAGISRPDQRIVSALFGNEPSQPVIAAPPPPPPDWVHNLPAPFSLTQWKFTGSSGVSISVAWGGVTTGNFYLEKIADTSKKASLSFTGIGASYSKAPASLSGSTQGTSSTGWGIRRGLQGVPLSFDSAKDFDGACGVITGGAAAAMFGGSFTIVTFGKMGLVMGYTAAKAFGALAGLAAGTPDVGLSAYIGKAGFVS